METFRKSWIVNEWVREFRRCMKDQSDRKKQELALLPIERTTVYYRPTKKKAPWQSGRATGEYTWSAFIRMQRHPQLGRRGSMHLRSTVLQMGEEGKTKVQSIQERGKRNRSMERLYSPAVALTGTKVYNITSGGGDQRSNTFIDSISRYTFYT